MKRILALTLGLLLCLALLVPTAGAEGVEIVYEGKPFAPITSEPVTISVLTICGGSSIMDWDSMSWFHKALEGTNINLEVELVDGSVYTEIMSTRLAAGVDLPDIILVSGRDADGTYVNAGLFQPLNAYVDQYALNLPTVYDRYDTLEAAITNYDGNQYFMPYYYLATEHARNMAYNVKLFEDNGLSVPTTTDELYETLKALKALGDWNGNGKEDEIPLFIQYLDFIKQMGSFWGLSLSTGYIANDEGVVESCYVMPEYKEFLLYANKLVNEGLMNADFTSSSWDQELALWSNNCVAMHFEWTANTHYFETCLDPDYDFTTDEPLVRIMEPLEGPYGDKFYLGRDPAGMWFGVTRECENPDIAFCVLDYFLHPDVIDMTWLGIEGIDYTKDAEGTITFTDVYLKNENNYRQVNGYNAEMFTGGQSLYGYGLAVNNPQNVAQWEVNAEMTLLPIGFAYLEPEYNDILQSYQTDLVTYLNESLTAFVLGTRDIESEWDSYVNACYGLGLEEMTKVYQARYDKSR